MEGSGLIFTPWHLSFLKHTKPGTRAYFHFASIEMGPPRSEVKPASSCSAAQSRTETPRRAYLSSLFFLLLLLFTPGKRVPTPYTTILFLSDQPWYPTLIITGDVTARDHGTPNVRSHGFQISSGKISAATM